ncbi:MAG: hypothetical protein JST70_04855 [Bacteroidetes bacterium]|nr:hypothetical protein [Bacteroidota bacterium]
MITTELKDQILNEIVDNSTDMFVTFNINELAAKYNVGSKTVDAMLHEYENRQFMDVDRMLGGRVYCNLTIRVYDFIKNGGYNFEDTIASIQLEKLKLEIQSLEGSIPNAKYTLLMTTIGAIATALTLFKK